MKLFAVGLTGWNVRLPCTYFARRLNNLWYSNPPGMLVGAGKFANALWNSMHVMLIAHPRRNEKCHIIMILFDLELTGCRVQGVARGKPKPENLDEKDDLAPVTYVSLVVSSRRLGTRSIRVNVYENRTIAFGLVPGSQRVTESAEKS